MYFSGVITGENQPTKEEIGRLLVFECSSKPEGEKISLAEASQTESPEIYYLAAPTRQLAEQSPYYESLKASLFLRIFWNVCKDNVIKIEKKIWLPDGPLAEQSPYYESLKVRWIFFLESSETYEKKI